jgi:hypothetical protein
MVSGGGPAAAHARQHKEKSASTAGPLPGTAVTKSEGRSFATSAFATRRENWGYDLFTRFNNRIGLYSAPVQQKQQIGFIFLVAKRLLQHIQR